MTNTKHTPGPWYQRNAYSNSEYFHVGSNARERVAVCHTDKDACIIAAAPELLEALEYLLPIAEKNIETSFGKDTIRIARAAIAKAKGE